MGFNSGFKGLRMHGGKTPHPYIRSYRGQEEIHRYI